VQGVRRWGGNTSPGAIKGRHVMVTAKRQSVTEVIKEGMQKLLDERKSL